MKFIVVIPARGGSKRLPRKNVLPLAGKPLICHSIEYALLDFGPEDVYVSTDSAEISQVAGAYGVNVVRRPEALSGDLTPTGDVLRHVSETLGGNGTPYDYMVLLQCTSPLRPRGMLRDAVEALSASGRKSLVGVTPWCRKLGRMEGGRFVPWNYRFGQRSQDMAPLYYEDGLVYITHRSLVEEGKVIDGDAYPFVVDHPYARVDIDTLQDFEYAEYVIRQGLP